MSSEQTERDARLRQEIQARRDAYAAGHDQTIINIAIGAEHPPIPGPLRPIWGNVPARNPGFTGREELLAAVREALLGGDRAVVQALRGMGGVGKTQLAVEYAHRFASSYGLVWWINAQRHELLGEQFAALAEVLGLTQFGVELQVVRRVVLAGLRERDRWLLVFDNAEGPEDVADWLPGGSGHVLITSRSGGWAEVAMPVDVDVLPRAESAAILRNRVPQLAAEDADQLAEALGDLPLAMVQASSYMAGTGMPAKEYMGLLMSRAGQLLDHGRPSSYSQSLAAATQLAFDKLRFGDQAAAELAAICSFLAPEPIPAGWFSHDPAVLPFSLAERAADPVAWRLVLAQLGAQALVRIDANGLQMHRLTQAIVRDHLAQGQAAAIRAAAEAIVTSNHPGDAGEPENWPAWARLLPHLLAFDPATSDGCLRDLACDASWYLIRRGDPRTGRDLASHLYQQWTDRLGSDSKSTRQAASALAAALRAMGQYDDARRLDEGTLAYFRSVLGDDDPDTLRSASGLATDLRALGALGAARDLDEDTLVRFRRVLGDDHQAPSSPPAILPLTCADWARLGLPGIWMKIPWSGSAASWVTTTQAPSSRPAASLLTCADWARLRLPGIWIRTFLPGAAAFSAATIPRR